MNCQKYENWMCVEDLFLQIWLHMYVHLQFITS